jgi:hypothetical protein
LGRNQDERKPEVGKTTHLVMTDGTEADMTLTGYQEEEDGDFTLSWTLQL